MKGRLRSAPALALAFGMLSAGAQAQDKTGCDQFKWSVARERAWFTAERKSVSSGAAIVVGQGYAVAMAPDESIAFAVPPEKPLKPGGLGATLSLANIDKAGSYEITLSDEGRIDAVQDKALVKSTDFSGQKDCPGVRKSVRFDLKSGPLTVQISNAPAATIDLAIAPAQ
jgi:hypothetical protein